MEQNFLMSATTKTLYDTDFAEWSSRTAEMLRNGRLAELDLENVAEEIESLGRSEHAAVRSQIKRLLMHKVKQIIQPERDGTSWRLSIADARQTILDHGGDMWVESEPGCGANFCFRLPVQVSPEAPVSASAEAPATGILA